MSSLAVYMGLDYHSSFIQACVIDASGRVRVNRRCGNDLASLQGVVDPAWSVQAVAIEACTGASDLAEALSNEAGWAVSLAHSGYVSKLKGSPDKSDFSDARLLADLSRVGYVPKVWLAPASIRALRQLVGHRQRLVDQRRATKLRVGALLREHRWSLPAGLARSRWSKAWIQAVRELAWSLSTRLVVEDLLAELDSLTCRIRRVKSMLQQTTAQDPVVARLLSLPGVGEVTAWMLRASVGQFDRFASGKQLARYCGLSPRNASSGQRHSDAGLIKAANRRLRSVLIQAGQRLMRQDNRWGHLGRKLLGRGKPYNVAVAAVANRWVRWVYHQMKQAM